MNADEGKVVVIAIISVAVALMCMVVSSSIRDSNIKSACYAAAKTPEMMAECRK